MKNLAGLMKQAQQMQSKMQEMQAKLESIDVEGVAGAGLVAITLNGKGDLRRVKIDPKLADPADIEMLEDLIVAAHRDAKSKLEAMTQEEMQKVTGGLAKLQWKPDWAMRVWNSTVSGAASSTSVLRSAELSQASRFAWLSKRRMAT